VRLLIPAHYLYDSLPITQNSVQILLYSLQLVEVKLLVKD